MGAPTSRAAFQMLHDVLRRAARRRQEQRRQLVVAVEILLAQPRDVARIFLLRRILPVAGRGLRIAVGEHRAHAGFLQALDAGVGVLRRVLDVRPVQHRGHADIDAAQRAEQVGDVGVLRNVVGAELLLDQRDVVGSEPSGSELRRNPSHMWRWVSTKPGITTHFDGIDHLGVRRADVRLHRRDFLALDQHVGLLEVADVLVEREHAAALDQDRPAGLRGRAARLPPRPRRSRPRPSAAPPRRPPPWCKGTAGATRPRAAGSTDSRN